MLACDHLVDFLCGGFALQSLFITLEQLHLLSCCVLDLVCQVLLNLIVRELLVC